LIASHFVKVQFESIRATFYPMGFYVYLFSCYNFDFGTRYFVAFVVTTLFVCYKSSSM
jgi:hypothetical protein